MCGGGLRLRTLSRVSFQLPTDTFGLVMGETVFVIFGPDDGAFRICQARAEVDEHSVKENSTDSMDQSNPCAFVTNHTLNENLLKVVPMILIKTVLSHVAVPVS